VRRDTLTLFLLLAVSAASIFLGSCSSNNGANNSTDTGSPSADVTSAPSTTAPATTTPTEPSPTPTGSPPNSPAPTQTTLPGLRSLTRASNSWVGTVTVASDGSSFLTACYDGTTVITIEPGETTTVYGDRCPGGIIAMYIVKAGLPRPLPIPGHIRLEVLVKHPTIKPQPGYEYRARVLPLGATPVP
jgi:hypothetical protein